MRPIFILLLLVRVASAEPEPKNPNIALTLSLGSTVIGGGVALLSVALAKQPGGSLSTPAVIGAGVGIAATIIGPTLGHVYVGKPWNRWLRLRLIGAGAIVVGGPIAMISGDGDACGFPDTRCSPGETVAFGLGILAVTGGAVMYIVGTGAEIGSAPRAADRYNRQLSVTPIATSQTLGLALNGTF